MINFLESFTLNYLTWFIIAILLITIELFAGANFFLLWLGIVAGIVGVLSWFIPAMLWQIQLLLFVVGSVFILFFWKLYLKKHLGTSNSKLSNLNRRNEQLIGRHFFLQEAIINGRGKIKVGDTLWIVEGEDLPINTTVKVVGVDGTTLKVERV